jgi:hypothetical protein
VSSWRGVSFQIRAYWDSSDLFWIPENTVVLFICKVLTRLRAKALWPGASFQNRSYWDCRALFWMPENTVPSSWRQAVFRADEQAMCLGAKCQLKLGHVTYTSKNDVLKDKKPTYAPPFVVECPFLSNFFFLEKIDKNSLIFQKNYDKFDKFDKNEKKNLPLWFIIRVRKLLQNCLLTTVTYILRNCLLTIWTHIWNFENRNDYKSAYLQLGQIFWLNWIKIAFEKTQIMNCF